MTSTGENGPLTVSVLIPTYNRLPVLQLCLEHLERQTLAAFEVVVVDDGSTDGTAAWLEGYTGPLRLRSVSQPNAGQARARNVAASLASGSLCVIIGDDILCQPAFLETHLEFHQQHPPANQVALGLTRWSETHQEVTPLMRWMDESGTQFAYGDLFRGTRPDWRHFYTSNLSLKTALLRQHPFSEGFKRYGMEDMELGYRLERLEQMQLSFLPAAVAEHVHPIDFAHAARRAFTAGRSMRIFDELWPDRQDPPRGRASVLLRDLLVANAWLLGPVTIVTGWVTRLWCPNPLIQFVMIYQFAVGKRGGVKSRPSPAGLKPL